MTHLGGQQMFLFSQETSTDFGRWLSCHSSSSLGVLSFLGTHVFLKFVSEKEETAEHRVMRYFFKVTSEIEPSPCELFQIANIWDFGKSTVVFESISVIGLQI